MKPISGSLPDFLQPFFWDVDFDSLDWQSDQNFIARRILTSGSWKAVSWLRSTWGDQARRSWLKAHQGSRLTPRQLRFWELLLDLPAQDVEQWIESARNNPWGRRIQP
jgi:hypothetical protein